MGNIDWRAFWTSMATIVIALIVYGIVIEPMIKKFNIRIFKPEAAKSAAPVEAPKA